LRRSSESAIPAASFPRRQPKSELKRFGNPPVDSVRSDTALIEGWDERQSARKKVEAVCGHLGVVPDFAMRPYLSIEKLRDFRNTLAHGKPEDKVFEQEVVATVEELEAMGILHAEWEAYVDQSFFSDAYADVDRIWADLLAKSGLTLFETLTGGGSQMNFIEHVDDVG